MITFLENQDTGRDLLTPQDTMQSIELLQLNVAAKKCTTHPESFSEEEILNMKMRLK